MGSVSSVNPGVADLLQTLTNLNSPVVSSQSTVTALEKASPSDIVQLSVAANQLEGVDAIFGIPTASSTADMSSSLLALENSTTGSATGSTASSVLASASPSNQAANAQAAIQAELTQGLFGNGANNSLYGTVVNTVG